MFEGLSFPPRSVSPPPPPHAPALGQPLLVPMTLSLTGFSEEKPVRVAASVSREGWGDTLRCEGSGERDPPRLQVSDLLRNPLPRESWGGGGAGARRAEQSRMQAGRVHPLQVTAGRGHACGGAGDSEAKQLPGAGPSVSNKASSLAGQGEAWGGSLSKVMVSGTCIIWQGGI